MRHILACFKKGARRKARGQGGYRGGGPFPRTQQYRHSTAGASTHYDIHNLTRLCSWWGTSRRLYEKAGTMAGVCTPSYNLALCRRRSQVVRHSFYPLQGVDINRTQTMQRVMVYESRRRRAALQPPRGARWSRTLFR